MRCGLSFPLLRRRRTARTLGLDAVRVIIRLGLLPLAANVVGLALLSHRLPASTRGGAIRWSTPRPLILLLALRGRLWHLSSRKVCLELACWPTLASACGLPPGQMIHPRSSRGECAASARTRAGG